MKWINHILITAMVLVAVAMFANADIPPAPAGLDNDTGEYWVNYTWSKELGDPVDDNVNVTDSFNVSMNYAWYNGTATFLNESVGPGGWANITVWAYNATGNGNMSVGGLSDNVQVPAMADPYQYPIMRPDSETRREWIERYNAAPAIDISGEGVMALLECSVLGYLPYDAAERDQGRCGNCWVWAGTGCMEVAHTAENNVYDRLSIQYPNSLCSSHCCGGWLSDLVDFYSVNTTIAVPWDNTNASWQDEYVTCGGSTTVPAASIETVPHYAITHIEERTITTFGDGIGQNEAINNIKSVLANDSAVWFAFFLPTGEDWTTFGTFWGDGSETDLWSPDDSCGHTWDDNGGGHAVLCVGYNDEDQNNRYWIMLNSWGTAIRPDGLFRMNMSIDYNCSHVDEGDDYYSLYWQMLDIDFADICVNENGWWRDGGAFNASTTPIQEAVSNAYSGETIHVAAGSYTENVHIGTPHLTLVGEGADVVTVTAPAHGGNVFSVTADYVNISGFNVTGAEWGAGIYLDDADYCNISDNNASDNYYGIRLSSSSNNTLTSNTASDNHGGIYLSSSSNNTLANNTMSENTYNFGVDGGSLSDYTQNIGMSNMVDGKPIYYWVDQQGGQIPTDAGYVGVVNSTNIIVRDLNLAKNFHGALFVNTSDSIIENVTASDNIHGIYLCYSSNNNTLLGNIANSNIVALGLPADKELPSSGIYLRSSSNNTLTGNTASGKGYGIWLDYSSNYNMLTDNTANSNNYHGIYLHYSSSNTLRGNIANSNIPFKLPAPGGSSGSGIYLHYSSSNTLTDNTASDNSRDIHIYYSPFNTFTDNTLNGTTVSFTYSGDVSLRGVGLPAAGESGWYSIGKFIEVMNYDYGGAWMILNFSYSDSDFTGATDESNLTVWKYNGTWYEDGWNGTRYPDRANNTVGVNITSFSVFAPMTTGVPALDHITVEPGSALLNIDDPLKAKSQTFAATGRSKHTDPIPDLMFGWSNTDTSVGGLNSSAGTVVNFTAERAGRAYLTANNGSVASGQVQVTVDGGADNATVANGTATATSGDANVTCNFGDDVDDGWINITAIGNATNSSEVNSSDPRYGLGDGDKAVSGVTVNVSDNIRRELEDGNGTIRIQICYNATTLAALGIDASTLAIWKYNSTTGWVKQPSTRSGTCVYVDVDHLCTFGLFGSKAEPTPSGGSSGGSGTYPPGWFGTPTPTVTATKAPAATTTATAAPPGERVTPAPTKKTAAAKTDAPAAEGTTAKKSAPGFTAVFVIAGMLAVAYVLMRRRE